MKETLSRSEEMKKRLEGEDKFVLPEVPIDPVAALYKSADFELYFVGARCNIITGSGCNNRRHHEE